MAGEDDLLFSPLDCRGQMEVVGLLQFLARLPRRLARFFDKSKSQLVGRPTYNVGELGLGDQGLGLGTD